MHFVITQAVLGTEQSNTQDISKGKKDLFLNN